MFPAARVRPRRGGERDGGRPAQCSSFSETEPLVGAHINESRGMNFTPGTAFLNPSVSRIVRKDFGRYRQTFPRSPSRVGLEIGTGVSLGTIFGPRSNVGTDQPD
jgi:hypothetical protein